MKNNENEIKEIETTEELTENKIKEVIARTLTKYPRNAKPYTVLRVAFNKDCGKEIRLTEVELALLKHTGKEECKGKITRYIGKESGKASYRMSIEIFPKYPKFVEFERDEYVYLDNFVFVD